MSLSSKIMSIIAHMLIFNNPNKTNGKYFPDLQSKFCLGYLHIYKVIEESALTVTGLAFIKASKTC